jgi:hypothetical protein
MAKKKKKLAPRPKPNPRAKPVDTSMGDNEFIADLLKSPFMKNNPLAKVGLYGLLPEERTPLPVEAYDDQTNRAGFYVTKSSGKPHKFNYGSDVKKKGMVAIRSRDGDIEYRYPQDIERMLIKDKTYVNVNPITNKAFARTLDKMKEVPEGTTSKLDAQINTIIHELMHRGFKKVSALKNLSAGQEHAYIEEKEKAAYSPRSQDNILRQVYEEELKKDPNISKYIKTHMPELYFKKSQGYLDKKATKPISTMTRLFRYLMK